MSMPLLLHGQEGHARISIYYEYLFLPWPTYHHNWWPYPERIKSTAFPKVGTAGVTLSKEIKNSRTTLLNLSSS
jgi:hypothetical protein